MIFSKRPANRRFDEPPPEKLDKLLFRFFRSEMAEPWPTCPALPEERATPAPMYWSLRFPRLLGRLAVAAAAVLLVASYVGLKNSFPEPRSVPAYPGLHESPFGFRTIPGTDRTRSGRPVEIEMKSSPDHKTILLKVQELPASK